MTLGAPAYSFQYTQQMPNMTTSTRTISGLNLNTEANDDGITPAAFAEFINGVFAALGISYTNLPKVIEQRVYEN